MWELWYSRRYVHCSKSDGFRRHSWADGRGPTASLLHRAPVDWFTSRHRELLEESCPMLKDKPPSIAHYVFVHHQMAKEKTLDHALDHLPTTVQLRSLLEHLPQPASEHGTKLASTHGDIWAANILRMSNGNAVFADFEQSCVSAAALDLAHELRGTESVYRALSPRDYRS